MEIGLNEDLDCRNCGSEYQFVPLDSPEPGHTREYCDICGKELLNWPAERCCEMQRKAR